MHRVIYILILFSLTSCINNYARQHARVEVEREIDLSEKTNEALEKQVCIEGNWPTEKWWEVFSDRQLNHFIEFALYNNPSLSSAEGKVRQANQEAYVVRAKLFPQLNLLANVISAYLSKNVAENFLPGVKLGQNFHLYTAALSFDYEFDFWKKNKNLFEAALGEMRVQKALSYQTKLVLSAAIAQEYFDLQGNMAKLRVMEEILERRSRYLELTQLRRVHRLDNLINVNQMKEEIVSLEQLIAVIKEELELEKSMIATLMGKNPTEKIELLSVWKTERKPCSLPQCIGLELMARRPDLMAQIWQVQKAARMVDVAIAEFYPNLDLKAFGGLQSFNLKDLFTSQGLTAGVLPLFSLPIFQGGRIKANFRARMEAYEVAVNDYNNALLSAANEVVQSITKVSSADEKIQYQEQNVALKRKNYDLIYSRYMHGIDSMISVLKADENYLWSRIGQIDLETEKYHAMIDLIKALGGGYQE